VFSTPPANIPAGRSPRAFSASEIQAMAPSRASGKQPPNCASDMKPDWGLAIDVASRARPDLQGLSVQGLSVQGLSVQGLSVQGLPVQGLPVQGLPVQGLPVARLKMGTNPGTMPDVLRVRGRQRAGLGLSQGFPTVGVAVPCDRAQTGERHVVGVDEKAFVSRAVQQPTASAHRPAGVVIPRGTPLGMAQLQLVIEEVADAEEPLAIAFQQDRGMSRSVTGGVDDADAGEDLGVIVERS
jgi:hypothetical protein